MHEIMARELGVQQRQKAGKCLTVLFMVAQIFIQLMLLFLLIAVSVVLK